MSAKILDNLSLVRLLSRDKQVELILDLMQQLGLSISDLSAPSLSIPISIFNKHLSCLETIVKYLKENQHLSFNSIAELINRNSSTIRTSYNNANNKISSKLDISNTEITIPAEIFKDRSKSVLQAIVIYMKDELKLEFKRIAELLNRDYKTVWTVYNK